LPEQLLADVHRHRDPDGKTARYILGLSCEKARSRTSTRSRSSTRAPGRMKRYPNLVDYEAKLASRAT
jgi:hypothetical protein